MVVSIPELWQMYGEATAAYVRSARHLHVRFDPDSWLALSGVSEAFLNWGVVQGGAGAVERMREYAAVVDAFGIPTVFFLPGLSDDEIKPVVEQFSWQMFGTGPLMVYQPDGERRQDERFGIERVVDDAQLAEVRSILAGAYHMQVESLVPVVNERQLVAPGFKCYLARHESQAMSTVVTASCGAAVGIFYMATSPERQRSGAGRALLEHVINDHALRGATIFYLAASEAGKPLYDRIGFMTVQDIPVYIAGLPANSPDSEPGG